MARPFTLHHSLLALSCPPLKAYADILCTLRRKEGSISFMRMSTIRMLCLGDKPPQQLGAPGSGERRFRQKGRDGRRNSFSCRFSEEQAQNREKNEKKYE